MSEPVPERLSTIVCFDLGGVLVQICRTWAEACELSGLPVRNPEWMSSGAWRTRRKAVVDDYQLGKLDCEAYANALSAAVDGLYSPDEVREIHRVWTQREYPGIGTLIDDLHALPSVRTACLSNTNHAHWHRLRGLDGRGEYPSVQKLGHHLASHLMRRLKPDPRIYAEADQALSECFGAQPVRVVFFDDLEDNARAAEAHGWRAHVVDPHADTADQMRRLLRDVHGLSL